MTQNLRSMLSAARRDLEHFCLNAVARKPRLAALYYALFDDALSREAAAVSAGRVRYQADTRSPASTFYLLRRNIHRIEKGLIMRPRRKVFALEYLEETISVYERAIHSASSSNREHIWAHDVLTEYFSVVDRKNPIVKRVYDRFAKLEANRVGVELDRPGPGVPYVRDLSASASIKFEDFYALSLRRRSVRWYLDQPVERTLVDKAISAAVQAPSACNRQPFVYRVIDDPQRARRIAAIPLGTKGFSDKLPAVIVVVGRLRAYPQARDRHAIYVDASLSAMALMYAFETLGLSTCPINWPDIEPQETLIAKELGLEPDERVVMLIAYGWPDPQGLVPFSAKREHDQIRQFN